MPRKSDDENQNVCLYATEGHLWMRKWYDPLPPSVRRRLQNSPYNLCAWCLVLEILPKVRKRYRGLSKEKALLVAVAVMEKMTEQLNKKKAAPVFKSG